MARKSKLEGIAAVVVKSEPVSIQELTMQDFFAAFALTAFLINEKPQDTDEPAITWAKDAYEFADAMLKARQI
jgi:hypothetical protein